MFFGSRQRDGALTLCQLLPTAHNCPCPQGQVADKWNAGLECRGNLLPLLCPKVSFVRWKDHSSRRRVSPLGRSITCQREEPGSQPVGSTASKHITSGVLGGGEECNICGPSSSPSEPLTAQRDVLEAFLSGTWCLLPVRCKRGRELLFQHAELAAGLLDPSSPWNSPWQSPPIQGLPKACCRTRLLSQPPAAGPAQFLRGLVVSVFCQHWQAKESQSASPAGGESFCCCCWPRVSLSTAKSAPGASRQ